MTETLDHNGTALVPVTVGGVTLPAGSTATDRFNAHMRSAGLPEYKPQGITFGPQGHPHVTVPDEATARAMTGKTPPPSTVSRAPPSPAELEASRRMPGQGAPSADRLAEFDAEMRAKGLQTTPPPPAPHQTRDAQGRFMGNPPAVEAVNAWYKALPAAERETKRGEYREKLQAAFAAAEGAPAPAPAPDSGEVSPADFAAKYSKPAGADGTRALSPAGEQLQREVLAEYAALTPAEQVAHRDDYNVSLVNLRANEDGMCHVSAFSPDVLHGYQLPKLIPDQHYSAEIIHDLAKARAAGITQAQLEAFIRDDMRKQGFNV